ncbi:MAG: T9SS type A sorting domain-containing protein [Lentimicrobiaceae bacterium]|nr:T9SS type A sorting domain-containing protein [Lentimicrobiaceae bacterium]
MKKSLFLILFFLTSLSMMSQNGNVIFQESFDDDILSGWSITDGGAANWSLGKTNNAGGLPNELQLAWTPIFEGLTRVVSTTPINLEGIVTATLSFKHDVYVYEDCATIGFATSSDNGNTWNTAWSKTYYESDEYIVEEAFNSPDFGKDNVMLCLYFEGSTYNINFWYFDDILIVSHNQVDANLIGINNQEYTLFGENEISFTLQNTGANNIETFTASYTIDGETVTETFNTNLATTESEDFTFETKHFFELGSHQLSMEITSVNGISDENQANNDAEKEIVAAIGLTDKIPMIEHFSSSTCGPCVEVNAGMEAFTNENEGKFTYTKYPMNWPGSGDPYYTSEAGIRKTFYDVSGVPKIFFDGIVDESYAIEPEELEAKLATPSIVNIRGAFNMDGNTINVTADFMSYIDIDNMKAFISVNEKTTTENVGSNGETEFHHIMMKMLEDAEGNDISISAGEYQSFEFSYDMSTTNVEEISDLEVALWLQDAETKEIFNSRFAYEYTEHVYPIQNMKLEEDGNNNLIISWDAPQNDNASGYNVYINNILAAENISELSYEHPLTETGFHVVEIVALYDDKTSVGVIETIDAVLNINENASGNISIYPNPAKDVIKLSAISCQPSVVRIYNCLGMLVEEIDVNSGEIEINVSDYNSGIYFIDVETSNGNFIKKMIVE